ncbi:tetratricopeptide repeat protein, partial [uncultured Megasphaera sp.]|uniref:tetratricopeptide repeat protein n=1 Tax=uncultured Megasphaera sp. TaxID=165188 RepID=UPI00265A993C
AYIEVSAKKGCAEAQNRLGEWYERKQDYKNAMEFYSLAAKQGQINAMYQLGLAYHLGRGVVHDDIMAINWLEKATSQGHAAAKIRLKKVKSSGSNIINQDHQKTSIEEAIERGHVEAKDFLEKVKFYDTIARLNPEDLYKKGVAYENGYGVARNSQKAVICIERAAEQGNAEAQFLFGEYYEKGYGVAKDIKKATEWYEKAAAWYEKNADWGKAEACRHKIERIAPKSAKKSAETNEPDKKANTSAVPKKSGCFITTAVCGSLKKGDHYYELTRFREFRDQWLALQEDGPALIQEYYAVAPAIVEKIQAQRQCEIVYQHIWNVYLKRCLTYIEEKKFDACKSLYIEMVRTLQDKYLKN